MTLLWLLLALQILIAAGTTYDIRLRRRIIAAQHTRLEQALDLNQEANR